LQSVCLNVFNISLSPFTQPNGRMLKTDSTCYYSHLSLFFSSDETE